MMKIFFTEGGRLPSTGRRGVGGKVLQVIVPNYLNSVSSKLNTLFSPTLRLWMLLLQRNKNFMIGW